MRMQDGRCGLYARCKMLVRLVDIGTMGCMVGRISCKHTWMQLLRQGSCLGARSTCRSNPGWVLVERIQGWGRVELKLLWYWSELLLILYCGAHYVGQVDGMGLSDVWRSLPGS